jgi:hypothetical protein
MAALLHQDKKMSIALIFALVSGIFSPAWAQPQTQPPPWIWGQPLPPGDAVTCMNNATTFGLLTEQQAYQLCVGAGNSAPFDCYQQATRATIDESTAIKLCRCSVTTSRVDCYVQAHSTTDLSESQVLDLCTHDINASSACSPQAGTG